MRQAGMVAYMSDASGRHPAIPAADRIAAEYEARAILAETEPTGPSVAFLPPIAVRAIFFGPGREEREALAASLAAVLPMLDELEAESRFGMPSPSSKVRGR